MTSPFIVRRVSFDAAIIDLDGTLLDTLGDFVAALERLRLDLAARGFTSEPFTAALVEPMVGKGANKLVQAALDCLLASNADVAVISKPYGAINSVANHAWACCRYQLHYQAVNGQHARLYPGVLAGLQALQGAGVAMACVTNKPLAFALELLALFGLAEFFGPVFGGDSFERKKPDPLPLLKACEALGTSPARTLMLGDSSNDAQAARAAGCPVVLVSYGYNHGLPVRAVDADGVVDSLAQLLPPVVAI